MHFFSPQTFTPVRNQSKHFYDTWTINVTISDSITALGDTLYSPWPQWTHIEISSASCEFISFSLLWVQSQYLPWCNVYWFFSKQNRHYRYSCMHTHPESHKHKQSKETHNLSCNQHNHTCRTFHTFSLAAIVQHCSAPMGGHRNAHPNPQGISSSALYWLKIT